MNNSLYYIEPKFNESTYSILSRVHLQSGNVSSLTTLKDITGIRGYKPLSGLPTHIRDITSYLNFEYPEKWLYDYTHFPFYALFLPKKRRKFLLDGMLYDGANKSRIGLLRSHCGAREQLAYCPECYLFDIDQYGFPYWHREHLVYGVEICHVHKCHLYNVNQNNTCNGERILQLPYSGTPSLVSSDIKNLEYIANQVIMLMNSKSDIYVDKFVYQKLLQEANLLTSRNHVRIKSLVCMVESWMKSIKTIKPYDKLYSALKFERCWVADLVSANDGFHHPLKHILIWGTLGVDFGDILNIAKSKMSQMSLPLDRSYHVSLSPVEIEKAILSYGSASSAAKHLNCCTTTLICYADKYGIHISKKAKKITYELKALVMSNAKNGKTTKEIAEITGLSITSVNRIKRTWDVIDII